MYTVYAGNTLIHDGSSPDLSIHLIDPVLKIGDAVAGSLTMTVPVNNPGYSIIERFTTTISVKKEGKLIWKGRVLTETQDLWNQRKLTAEGALAYLNDSTQEMQTYTHMNLQRFIGTLLDNHNAKVSSDKQFRLGMITVHDLDDDYMYQTSFKSTWDEFKTNCLDRLEGHVRLRYGNDDIPYLDYLEEFPNTATQQINFGHNLLDFTRNWDESDIATVIIPLGKRIEKEAEDEEEIDQPEYTTVASVNDGSIYVVNQDAYNTFGRVEQVVNFSDIDDPSTLLQMAQVYISVQQFDALTMTVNAIDLHRLASQTSGHSNPKSFELFDEVRCISQPHGLDRMFPITEISIPLDRPEGVTYTMGSVVTSPNMTTSTLNRTSEILDRIKNLPQTTNILGLAKRQAAQILNQRTTGYVTITEVDEASQALIISNTPDWENATKRWIFNINGLGYTRDKGETYDIAITMDGTIVADFIKTGILEDGYGLNYWNLSTGEFSLAWNTEFRNLTGDVITVVDINELANTANDAAEAAQDYAEEVEVATKTEQKKQSGSTNLINGTDILKFVSSSDWSLGTWTYHGTGSAGSSSVENADNPPNQKIKKQLHFRINQTVSGSDFHIMQAEVPLGYEQAYCISCYAKGVGNLRLQVGKTVRGQPMYANAVKPVSDEWRRYHMVFGTGKNNTYEDAKYIAGIIDNRVDVMFGCTGEAGQHVYICGMKVERGNTPTDWGESDFDTQVLANEYTDKSSEQVKELAVEYADAQADKLETFTKEYVEVVSDSDREFTKSQREALDESFTQAKVLKRLTNNYQSKGIYLQDNQLYMNATYIRTGTLDAGIVKTGILTDRTQTNKWNLATGYLYTKNMEAVNAKLSGRFECGSTYKIQLENGTIYGYKNSTYVGSIDYTADMYNLDNQRHYSGLMLRGNGGMQIRMPSIAVRQYNDNGIATTGCTKRLDISVISQIDDIGNGAIRWWTTTHGIDIINGIVVSVW